jgi:uncharacterized protein (TIGR02996 family)
MTSLQRALEAALVEDPDDVAAHMAYGDYLAEQGDPRGEFVQVQIALEDTRRPPAERRRLARREAELLERRRDEWLGPLAPHFPLKAVTFRRGWIDALRVHTLTVEVARALAGAAELRLLRRLTLVNGVDLGAEPDAERFDGHPFPCVIPLFHAAVLANVRSFSLGDAEGDAGFRTFPYGVELGVLCGGLPRLTELHVNAIDAERAVPDLSLPALRVLRLERVRLGDEGVGRLSRSGLLRGLKVLQLWNARFSDRGARALARCPALKNLALLDVSFNWLTDAGIAALRKACPAVVAEYQMTRADDVDDEYGEFDEFELTLE